jgi:6-phosphogluconolactonase
MKAGIHIFKTPYELAEALSTELYRHLGSLGLTRRTISLALSGGSTPQIFFKKTASYLNTSEQSVDWKKVHFYWCDERCVPPHHPESNFGMTSRFMLRALDIEDANIHRIRGESIPEEEAVRYSEEIRKYVLLRNNMPVFDWIFLGIGDDGHTASLFPDQLNLLYSDKICEAVAHPQTGQKRITLTGKPLINAQRITFVVTGKSKSQRVKEIIREEAVSKLLPARYIRPVQGRLEWYLDEAAAERI